MAFVNFKLSEYACSLLAKSKEHCLTFSDESDEDVNVRVCETDDGPDNAVKSNDDDTIITGDGTDDTTLILTDSLIRESTNLLNNTFNDYNILNIDDEKKNNIEYLMLKNEQSSTVFSDFELSTSSDDIIKVSNVTDRNNKNSKKSPIPINDDNIEASLNEILNMSRNFTDSACKNMSSVSLYVHNFSDSVVRLLKYSIEDIKDDKISDIVKFLETYEATLMFLAFNAKTFENVSWHSVHDKLRENRFEKRVIVLCKKYFKSKPINKVVAEIRKYKQSLIKTGLSVYKLKNDRMFCTKPNPNIRMLVNFQPLHFTPQYS